MKKRLILQLSCLSLLVGSAPLFAADAPTVYGLVKKEILYIDQDSAADRREFYGPTDVDGLESRLGVKGALPAGDALKAMYNFELGLNSSLDNAANGADERIRIRAANGSLGSEKIGFLTVGQALTLGIGRMLALDPFYGTSLSALGTDYVYVAGWYRTPPLAPRGAVFMNEIAYSTPIFAGLKLNVAFDNNDQTSVERTTTAERWWTTSLEYDGDFSGVKLALTGNYGNQDKDGTIGKRERDYWQLGSKVMVDRFSLALAYTANQSWSTVANKKVTDNMWLGSLSFKALDALTLAANYSITNFDKNGSEATGGLTGDQQEFAFGAFYAFSENVSTHLALGFASRESKTALGAAVLPKDTTLAKKDNDATLAVTGITMKF
ncbi:MAG: porin [Oligoflexia bacterium]|nr:porin [Oligoflexia bacterium]MBF0364736.1 porin [Oligoflexia bacterium]